MPISAIPENDRKERFVASAGQTIFPFDFPIYDATDLQVKREQSGVESTLTLGTDYMVTGAGDQAGGTITLTAGALAGDIIVLLSAMPSGRTGQFVNGGDLPATALESEFNRIRILLQQILRDARAGLLYPQTDGPMPDLPPIASRAGRFLAFDAQGQPYAAGAPGTALDAVARAGDTMTGPLRIAAGSAAAPGLTPAGNPYTGIFAPAADEIGISLNGQEVARFNSNGLVGRLVPRTWLDVASAAIIDLGAQNADSLRVTGTTAISGFGTAPSGTRRRLRFAGVLTITHSAALICPGAANIITAAGDVADVESLGAGNWVVTSYQRALAFGGYQQIQRQTVSGVSAVDFTLPSGFRQFRLEISNGRVGTSGQSLGLRCGVGATFDAGASDYSGAYLTHSGTSPISDAGASGSFINLTLGLAVNDLRSLVEVAIDPGSASSRFMARISSGVIQSTGPSTRFYNAFYFRTDDGAKDAIRILASGGANIAGTFTLLGISA